jgi:hypothetical protein
MTAPKTISRKKRKAGQESSPDLAAVLAALPAALSVSRYQALASGTDLTARRGVRKLDFPLLGLFGEIGSLLSELKKKQRDTVPIPDMRSRSLKNSAMSRGIFLISQRAPA